ncbi:MAG: 5-(carboxyamino)imidazole ribonucleotide synthase [Acidimicrobiales bacterium]
MTMLHDPRHVPHCVPDSQSDTVARARSQANCRRTASAKVAMIGAGQLARMTHQAAVDLDIDLLVLAESPDDSAVIGGASYQLGSASCLAAIRAVAAGTDVVTFDHELVPGTHLTELERLGYRLRPASPALSLAQDKLKARTVLSAAGFPVPAFASVSSPQDVAIFAEQHGWPIVVKSPSGGYDGRGVHLIDSPDQLEGLFAQRAHENQVWLAEQFVEIAAELSILVARTVSGYVALYPAVQTIQQAGICRYLVMPAPLPSPIIEKAGRTAKSIADGIDATGMLAVEMFLDTRGQLLVNELALRPHNSGHATIEACETSQFHQHLRAALDWPLGATTLRSPAATVNLIAGPDIVDLAARLPLALEVSGAHIHLYGKASRPGRKLGHVTALGSSTARALETAQAAAALLTRP